MADCAGVIPRVINQIFHHVDSINSEYKDVRVNDCAGVIPRAINQIFHHLDSINSEYTVKCSFLELYNEETTDLLAIGDALSRTGDRNKLRMLEDKSGVVVQNLEEIIVKTSADIYGLLDRGSAKRRTAETLLNKQSSRSHSVFCVTVSLRSRIPALKPETCSGTLEEGLDGCHGVQ